jgi:hypothetical protein
MPSRVLSFSHIAIAARGFNTIGNWSNADLWAMHRLPYTVPLFAQREVRQTRRRPRLMRAANVGPLRSALADAADKMARCAAAQCRGDTHLIGYFVDNEPS